MRQAALLFFFIVVILSAARAQAPRQTGSGATGTITVSGIVTHPLTVHATDLATWKRVNVRAKDHDGKEYLFSGVSLADILLKAGAPLGAQLRGKQMATCLLVKAADGYSVTFALPELDSAFTDRVILLADQVDGKPLPPAKGPFRLVVPGDKKQARWIWGVTAIVVLRADDHATTN